MQRVNAPAGSARAALGSAAFSSLAIEDIAPEDVFFHKFMTLDTVRRRAAANRAKRKGKAAKKRAEEGEDGVLPDETSSDEEEGVGGGEDDNSAAEDAFLDGEEALLVSCSLLCGPALVSGICSLVSGSICVCAVLHCPFVDLCLRGAYLFLFLGGVVCGDASHHSSVRMMIVKTRPTARVPLVAPPFPRKACSLSLGKGGQSLVVRVSSNDAHSPLCMGHACTTGDGDPSSASDCVVQESNTCVGSLVPLASRHSE
jgi:hypothetical protein